MTFQARGIRGVGYGLTMLLFSACALRDALNSEATGTSASAVANGINDTGNQFAKSVDATSAGLLNRCINTLRLPLTNP